MKYKGQEVVYIEYQDGKPHLISTADPHNWTLDHYDFEIDCNEDSVFMHYHSGGGGFATQIQAPTYKPGCEETCCFWLHPKAKINGEPKNIKQIKEPLIINGTSNPFVNSREIYDLIYCKHCDKHLDEEWCDHLDTDEDGTIIYKNGELHES